MKLMIKAKKLLIIYKIVVKKNVNVFEIFFLPKKEQKQNDLKKKIGCKG